MPLYSLRMLFGIKFGPTALRPLILPIKNLFFWNRVQQ